MTKADENLWHRLLWTISLADHLGDVAEALRTYAQKTGLPFPEDWHDLNEWRDWLEANGISKGIHGG